MNSISKICNVFGDDDFEVPVYQICWDDFWDRSDEHEDIYEAKFMHWLGSDDGLGFVSHIRGQIESAMYRGNNKTLIKLKISLQTEEDGVKITTCLLDSFSMPFKAKYIEELFSEFGYKVKILADENKNKDKFLEISWQ
jgi:hypothetical protein